MLANPSMSWAWARSGTEAGQLQEAASQALTALSWHQEPAIVRSQGPAPLLDASTDLPVPRHLRRTTGSHSRRLPRKAMTAQLPQDCSGAFRSGWALRRPQPAEPGLAARAASRQGWGQSVGWERRCVSAGLSVLVLLAGASCG